MSEQGKANSGNNPVMNVEARIGQYLALRDKVAEKKKALEAELKPYTAAMKLLEGMFLGYLSETKQTSARTATGTTYILDRTSATVEDAAVFRQHIVDNQLWHLVDWRANAPKVEEWSEANEGALPPGIKFTRFRTTGVRRSD